MSRRYLAFFCLVVSVAMPLSRALGAELTLAGGCFWSMQKSFEMLKGVSKVEAGYTGGSVQAPTYEQVSTGTTGHLEAIKVTYDPAKIALKDILSWYWRQINPTQANGQFSDIGEEYKSAIFYATEAEKAEVQRSKDELNQSKRFDKPIATTIRPAGPFYRAETYHQDFYLTHHERYDAYRKASGRPSFFEKSWGKDYAIPALMRAP